MLISKIPILFKHMRSGDVIVFKQPAYGTLIKLVDRLEPGDEVQVVGLQEGSVDSREFGAIPRSDIVGKVIWHIKRP